MPRSSGLILGHSHNKKIRLLTNAANKLLNKSGLHIFYAVSFGLLKKAGERCGYCHNFVECTGSRVVC